MAGDQTPWVFLKTPFDERNGRFSPDGRFVAYASNESERPEPMSGRLPADVVGRGAGVDRRRNEWALADLGLRQDHSDVAAS